MKFIDHIMKEVKEAKRRSVRCKVTEVDDERMMIDCEPVSGGAAYLDVALISTESLLDGLRFIPKIGSYVTIITGVDNDAFVAQYGELKKCMVKIGDKTLEITSEGLKLNGDGFGSLTKIEALVTKLNAIEDDINDLKEIFKSQWVTSPNDGGAALKAASSGWSSQNLTKTKTNDLENKNVTHG